MTAYVEQLGWSKVGVDPIERSLQILRLLLSDGETRRKELTPIVDVMGF